MSEQLEPVTLLGLEALTTAMPSDQAERVVSIVFTTKLHLEIYAGSGTSGQLWVAEHGAAGRGTR